MTSSSLSSVSDIRKNAKNKNDDDEDEEGSDSSYFESMSSSSNSALAFSEQQEEELINRMNQLGGVDGDMSFLFSSRQAQDPQVLQQNSEALHRLEHGGVVVYDSHARIKGNTHLTNYYENNPPQRVDFNILFSREEILKADRLFHKEPRERDFQNDFDKFIYKHLPKFQPERDFGGSQIASGQSNGNNINNGNSSQFENGNLRRAMKVNNVEYNLLLENDVNTKGHTQWYYFKVIHKYPKKQKIQFNILNLAKPQSLYSQGMKPCIYSKQQNQKTGRGWFRGGQDIKYFQNEIPRKTGNPTAQYNGANSNFLYNNNGAGEGLEYHFTLSFVYEFEEEEDEVWFAHAIPFTYTDLQHNLIKAQKVSVNKQILKTNIMCKTLGGSPCPMITITEKIDTYLDYYDDILLNQQLPNVVRKQLHKKYQKCKKLYKQSMESRGKVRKLLKAAFEEEFNSFYEKNSEIFIKIDQRFENYHQKLKQYIIDHYHKKAVIITSRVHPGEPQASYMLQGTLDYLLSDEAANLRKHFVFRIVPMLNVDGVIYGNYRCSLLGVDLNRKWMQPNIFLHPTVYYAKQLVRYMHNERRVLMYCDMHGHSRKENAFFYACTYKNFEHEGRIKNAQLRIIPLLCCHKNNILKFKDCRFKIEKCKESTARVVVFREFNIMNSFTFECSFYGYENIQPQTLNDSSSKSNKIVYQSKPKIKHFEIKDYISLGVQLAQVLNNYLPTEQSKLSVLSGKILEIFYDEFIKFIPPYVLKREEERKKQMNLENNASIATPDVNLLPKQTDKSPKFNKNIFSNTSPKGQNVFAQGIVSQTNFSAALRSQSIKKQRKSFYYGNQPSSNNNAMNLISRELESTPKASANSVPKKQKAEVSKKQVPKKRRQTFAAKKGIVSADSNVLKQDNILLQLQSEREGLNKEPETFSQMIKIHNNQDELIDLEVFIKGIKQQIQYSKEQSQNDSGAEDENDGSDSSDGQEIVQSFYAQQQKGNNAKPRQSKKPKTEDISNKANLDQQQYRSIDSPLKTKSINRRQTILKNQITKQLISIDEGKSKMLRNNLLPLSQEPSLEQDLLNINTQSFSRKREKGLQSIQLMPFDKISHRKETSPSFQQNYDSNQGDLIFGQGDIKSTQSKNNQSFNIKSMMQEQQDQLACRQQDEQASLIFKSYEELKQQTTVERKRIIPLYENPLYHQNRLTTKSNTENRQLQGSELFNGDFNNAINTLAQQLNTNNFALKSVQGNNYEPYDELKSSSRYTSSINNNLSQSPIKQKQTNIVTTLNQLQISPLQQQETQQRYQKDLKNQSSLLIQSMPQDIYSNRKQRFANMKNGQQSQEASGSMQRMSFKELLETSRQTRISDRSNIDSKSQNTTQNTRQNQKLISGGDQMVTTVKVGSNQTHLLQMLKSTYQRFQNQKNLATNQTDRQAEEELPEPQRQKVQTLESQNNRYFNKNSNRYRQPNTELNVKISTASSQAFQNQDSSILPNSSLSEKKTLFNQTQQKISQSLQESKVPNQTLNGNHLTNLYIINQSISNPIIQVNSTQNYQNTTIPTTNSMIGFMTSQHSSLEYMPQKMKSGQIKQNLNNIKGTTGNQTQNSQTISNQYQPTHFIQRSQILNKRTQKQQNSQVQDQQISSTQASQTPNKTNQINSLQNNKYILPLQNQVQQKTLQSIISQPNNSYNIQTVSCQLNLQQSLKQSLQDHLQPQQQNSNQKEYAIGKQKVVSRQFGGNQKNELTNQYNSNQSNTSNNTPNIQFRNSFQKNNQTLITQNTQKDNQQQNASMIIETNNLSKQYDNNKKPLPTSNINQKIFFMQRQQNSTANGNINSAMQEKHKKQLQINNQTTAGSQQNKN
eukprot:403365502